MSIRKYLILQNYFDKYKKIRKKLIILLLSAKKFEPVDIVPIWKVSPNLTAKNHTALKSADSDFFVFGIPVSFHEIQWHRDSFSKYTYSPDRIDKLKVVQLFNKGIDIVFPWEQSRFYFAPVLAIRYINSKDKAYYNLLKSTIQDWINKNPYLHGVNWLSTMDSAIRAVNWIVAANLFGEIFHNDKSFKAELSRSMVQHAEFISKFPAVYEKKHITNHTTSAYTGLLFLALTLRTHPKSGKWLDQATKGLVRCIEYQVYDDGVDFEGSILYHRLVLELFAYSAILCLANDIKLPDNYFQKLYRMFEFTEAYLDQQGNAPQVGDNDSGRLLILNEMTNFNFYENELNHSYLMNLKNLIYNQSDSLTKHNCGFKEFIPSIVPVKTNELNISLSNKKTRFNTGGAYFVNNDKYSLLVSCFPLGQKGRGGHNHLDTGSFTLSICGKQVIVDPGSPMYSRNKKIRDLFRSYPYHNTLFTDADFKINWEENGYWGLKKFYDYRVMSLSEEEIKLEISFLKDKNKRYRTFLLKDDLIIIEDKYDGNFSSRINFHPETKIISNNLSTIKTNLCEIFIQGCTSSPIGDYDYSPHYGKIVKAKYLNISANNELRIYIKGQI